MCVLSSKILMICIHILVIWIMLIIEICQISLLKVTVHVFTFLDWCTEKARLRVRGGVLRWNA